MTAATLEQANEAMRQAVSERLAGTPANDPKMIGYEAEGAKRQFYGHAAHPKSQEFYDLCEELKEMHRRKSSDYGCPTGTDPLANIRNGAKFVGIPAWKAAMVRLSDKVTRLATYNSTGTLSNETVEDSLLDLASYSLLALVLHREETR